MLGVGLIVQDRSAGLLRSSASATLMVAIWRGWTTNQCPPRLMCPSTIHGRKIRRPGRRTRYVATADVVGRPSRTNPVYSLRALRRVGGRRFELMSPILDDREG